MPWAACTLIGSLHAVRWKIYGACVEVTIVCREGPQEAQPEPPSGALPHSRQETHTQPQVCPKVPAILTGCCAS